MATQVFQRGESILLALLVVAGDPAAVTTSTASLRPALAGNPSTVDASQAAVAAFTMTLQPAAAGFPAFWLLRIAPNVSAGLALGHYLVDARLSYATGDIAITDPLQITIVEPATAVASTGG